MDPDHIVIKKYANRRLYDTSNSRYINLEDIAALVRNGKDVQVVDASSGEDITRVTLTQIIVEDAKGQPVRAAAGTAAPTDRRLRPRWPGIHHVVSEVGLRCLSESAELAANPLERDAIGRTVTVADGEKLPAKSRAAKG